MRSKFSSLLEKLDSGLSAKLNSAKFIVGSRSVFGLIADQLEMLFFDKFNNLSEINPFKELPLSLEIEFVDISKY